jgi:type II secretory ATPase GspE/PulE/Tfp pilus assembly ATPase PilB-like protein
MIGEIRDRETAEIAIHSALTGHLVLSTLHTNDSPSSLFRLMEMGLESYLLNASVIGVVAQRIIRKNCKNCSEPASLPDEVMKKFSLQRIYESYGSLFSDGMTFLKGSGCPLCAGTGYKGRIAIFECFEYTDHLKEIFVENRALEVMQKTLVRDYGFRTLREDGMIKVMKGLTTIEEVLRVT